ncbi:hypothetical protein FIBSPDRAFT_875594, partial [Athelia psychrophila]
MRNKARLPKLEARHLQAPAELDVIEADNNKEAGGVHTCGDHDSTHNLRVKSARHAQRLRDFLKAIYYLT